MKGRLFIFEGADCCGKTTLAKKFADRFGMFYFHCTASKLLFPALQDYHNNIMENVHTITDMGYDIVLDRFWPSEYVYGLNLFRPHSGYEVSRIQELVSDHKSKYIFCFSAFGWIRYAKGHTDPAHSLTIEQYHMVYNTYKSCMEQQNIQYPGSAMSYVMEIEGKTDDSMSQFMNLINIWNR